MIWLAKKHSSPIIKKGKGMPSILLITLKYHAKEVVVLQWTHEKVHQLKANLIPTSV